MHAAASTRVVQTHHFALGMVSCAQFWIQPGACAPCWSPVAHSERIQGTPRDPQAHADPRWAYPDAQGGGPWGVQGGVLFTKPPGRSCEWGQGRRTCARVAHLRLLWAKNLVKTGPVHSMVQKPFFRFTPPKIDGLIN